VGSFRSPTDAELLHRAGWLRVMTTGQLLLAGLSKKTISRRVAEGRLQRLWHGVYLVGAAAPGPLSLAKGAHLACKGDAWVSHTWACHVLGFAKPPQLPVDITVASGSRRGRPQRIRIHRTTTLAPQDLAARWTIPVTSAARSILGCAETYSLVQLEALIADAFAARAVTDRRLDELAARAGRTRAARKLRVLRRDGVTLTRSEAERILRRLLRQAGLPLPITDYRIGTYLADFAWPALRLVVEFDGFATHGHKQAFSSDRKRGARITAGGWSVMHITWDQLIDAPYEVVAQIAGAIAVREAAL
jgi:very-short-patch-repair endonuclease